MSVSIRMKRMGSNKRPYYRLMVAEGARATNGKAFECVGTYNPLDTESPVKIDTGRIEEWVRTGARMSPAVKKLVRRAANQET